ncbi:hypothetical protein V9T40_012692 [Parthenolecanium corni]|uniref:Uncharacterized protein n=1 Tax=Parthenolecanium corni TaxID=536013 RepID=A0AAN9XZC9_9HEMI
MIFHPWRNELNELVNIDQKLKFFKNLEIIKINRKKFVFNDNLDMASILDELRNWDEESDDGDGINDTDERTANEFVVLDDRTQEGDIMDDIQCGSKKKTPVNKKKKENTIDLTAYPTPLVLSDDEYFELMRLLNEKQKKYCLHVLHEIKRVIEFQNLSAEALVAVAFAAADAADGLGVNDVVEIVEPPSPITEEQYAQLSVDEQAEQMRRVEQYVLQQAAASQPSPPRLEEIDQDRDPSLRFRIARGERALAEGCGVDFQNKPTVRCPPQPLSQHAPRPRTCSQSTKHYNIDTIQLCDEQILALPKKNRVMAAALEGAAPPHPGPQVPPPNGRGQGCGARARGDNVPQAHLTPPQNVLSSKEEDWE